MTWKRVFPLAVLVILIGAAFAFRIDRYLTLDALRDNRAALLAFVEANGLLAAGVFVFAYAAIVALSVPGATIMTLGGGFLFGVPLGASLTVIGATLGATLLFLIARSAAGDFFVTVPAHFSRACPRALARTLSTTCCSCASYQPFRSGP